MRNQWNLFLHFHPNPMVGRRGIKGSNFWCRSLVNSRPRSQGVFPLKWADNEIGMGSSYILIVVGMRMRTHTMAQGPVVGTAQ